MYIYKYDIRYNPFTHYYEVMEIDNDYKAMMKMKIIECKTLEEAEKINFACNHVLHRIKAVMSREVSQNSQERKVKSKV